MEGIIYLLSHPTKPGILKIGKTTKEDVKLRMKELYSSGVPLPFDCLYAAKVRDIDSVEKALHTAFSPDRVNPKREFFEIEATQAIAILKLLENVSPLVEQEEKWYFSVIDVIQVLTDSTVAKRYWSDLKKKLLKEGSQAYDFIVHLKMKTLF